MWAILLIAVGGSWLVSTQTGFFYAIVLFLVIIDILVVVSALPTMRKK
jgi:hypothetical protein